MYLLLSLIMALLSPFASAAKTNARQAALFNFAIVRNYFTMSDYQDNMLFCDKKWQTSSKPYNEIIFIQFHKSIDTKKLKITYDTTKAQCLIIPVNHNKSKIFIINIKSRKNPKLLTTFVDGYFFWTLPGDRISIDKISLDSLPVVAVRQAYKTKPYRRSVEITDNDTVSAVEKGNTLIFWEKQRLCIGKIKNNTFYGYKITKGTKAEKVQVKVKSDKNRIEIKEHKFYFSIPDSAFVLLRDLDSSITEDIRYATDNNFMHRKMYPCATCMLRYIVAKDLVAVNNDLRPKGLRLKVYDCYRPFSVQVKMWNKIHNINYVAPPSKGSMHNRGAAVDLTITTNSGEELDMGTGFDFFGPQASPKYMELPDNVLKNRAMLDSVMIAHNFRPIRTEWWHFYHIKARNYAISDIPLPCKSITE